MNDWDRIYRELQESGGIESAHDLTVFVEMVDGLVAGTKELKAWREFEEWVHKNYVSLGYAPPDTTFAPRRLHIKIGNTYIAAADGDGILAAIAKAVEGK